MTTKTTEARREAFEAFARDHYWLCEISHERDDLQFSEYVEPEMNVAWEAYNAALDSICVELPKRAEAANIYDDYDHGYNCALYECTEALTAAGVPYK